LDVAVRLAEQLRDQQLTVFIGAGVSAAAGLPDWARLIHDLSEKAQLDPPVKAALPTLEVVDQATVLKRGLEKGGSTLEAALQKALRADTPALPHWLLANLGVREAATTNYDDLLEQAADALDRPFKRVRYEEIGPRDRWLLKLHGTLVPKP
jgi:NAD-dependent SIR2 family protein deacetylase